MSFVPRLVVCCFFLVPRVSTWYPISPISGEEVELVDTANVTFISDWRRREIERENSLEKTPGTPSYDAVADSVSASASASDSSSSSSSFSSSSSSFDGFASTGIDSITGRDREPLDDVERIEPRHWPPRPRPNVFPTRSAFPSSTERSLSRNPLDPSILAQRNPSTQRRYPSVSAPLPTASVDEVFCDFGSFPAQSLCEWQNGNGALNWMAGTGLGTNWMGGPPSDSTSGSMEGGYAFLETSQVPSKSANVQSPGGLLHSPQLGSTGVSGTCLTFKYAMDGLSIAGSRVLLHAGVDEYSVKKEQAEDASPENTTSPSCRPAEILDERVLWHAQYYALGVWQQGQILYTYPEVHSLIIEGVAVDPADPSRIYRGYIAVDDIDLQPGTSCVGFCNFAGGFCDWNNDAEDDFDWTISRGSGNPATGPTMDSSSDRSTAGGYAYIDSGFPRRPGDTARLVSTSFPATSADAPMCMHFWFHMFGSGIGSLKLYLRHVRSLDAPLREIWGLTGNAGNAWFVSEITIGSLDDFQLIFEASVGNTGTGDIAIDDISFAQGACPVSPQVAAPILRDCTFEIDECDWINSRDPDRVEWERVSSQSISPRNQRKPYTNGYTINRRNEYFLGLARPRGGARSFEGGTARLVSRQTKPTNDEPLCVGFWYLMFEPFVDSSGPSLGVLRVVVQPLGETSEEPRPVWQLYNNQGPTWKYAQAAINEARDFEIVFEGTWGPNRSTGTIAIDDVSFYTGNCTVRPAKASVRPEDCSFEKGLCGWENITSSDNERQVTWQRAFLAHRPAQLLDKTFGASGDFVFFDIFTNNQKSSEVQLRSPVVETSPDEESVCFTFWFAAFGVEESTTLQLIKISAEEESASAEEQPLWTLTAKGFNNPRPVWTAAQVTIDARTPYSLILKGTASNGGFAIDDIKFQPQSCPTRPVTAQPAANGI